VGFIFEVIEAYMRVPEHPYRQCYIPATQYKFGFLAIRGYGRDVMRAETRRQVTTLNR